MASRADTGLGRTTWLLLALAALWGAALVVAALTVPSGTVTVVTTAGPSHAFVAHRSDPTLVAENGIKVLALVAVPLVAVLGVGGSLALRRRRGRPGAGPVAWALTTVVGAICLVGLLTIGIFVIPVAALLVVCCARSAPDHLTEEDRARLGPAGPPPYRPSASGPLSPP